MAKKVDRQPNNLRDRKDEGHHPQPASEQRCRQTAHNSAPTGHLASLRSEPAAGMATGQDGGRSFFWFLPIRDGCLHRFFSLDRPLYFQLSTNRVLGCGTVITIGPYYTSSGKPMKTTLSMISSGTQPAFLTPGRRQPLEASHTVRSYHCAVVCGGCRKSQLDLD